MSAPKMHYLSGRCGMAVVVDLSGKWSILLNSSTFECILPFIRSNRTRTLSRKSLGNVERNGAWPRSAVDVGGLVVGSLHQTQQNERHQKTSYTAVQRCAHWVCLCVCARWGKGDSDREEMFARQLHFSRTDIRVVFLFVDLLVFFLFEHI